MLNLLLVPRSVKWSSLYAWNDCQSVKSRAPIGREWCTLIAGFTLTLTFDTHTLARRASARRARAESVHTLSKHKSHGKMTQLLFRRDGEWCSVSCSCSSDCKAAERRRAQPSPSRVVHLLKTREWRKECCKEWRAWMSIWASPCPSISSWAGHLPAALTLRVSKRVSVWTQHNNLHFMCNANLQRAYHASALIIWDSIYCACCIINFLTCGAIGRLLDRLH